MKTLKTKLFLAFFISSFFLFGLAGVSEAASPDSGVYAIWYSDLDERGEQILDLPFVIGGQIYRQWRWMEPSEGVYKFSQMDAELQELYEKGMKTTLQVNGEYKPDWLFEKVPYHDEQMGQVLDSTGSLMYWHPAHLNAYKNFLAAFAEYIKTSPYESSILGVRMNINALGTEHTAVPSEYRSLDQWNVPTGVEPGVEWTATIKLAYISKVLDTFISEFSGHTTVFVRNNIDSSIKAGYLDEFNNGTLSWFHTSSEAEPRNAFTEGKYETFLDYARTGKTTAYAENYADAWGIHGTILDDRWCSPPKWNYWRLLIDLHCGVSFIAAYGVDLGVALDGTYHNPTYKKEHINYDDGASGTYQSEFTESFRFAAKYAGYHASPKQSPGAWIAFRENDVVIAENGISEAARTLQTITSDYTFLMERLPDNTLGQDIINIGPDDQRYGAWARQLPSYETINLNLNELFIESIDAQNVKLKIIYFYNQPASDAFVVKASGNEFSIPVFNTGKWEIAEFTITNADFNKDLGSHIVIESGNRPVYFHMVEIIRDGAFPPTCASQSGTCCPTATQFCDGGSSPASSDCGSYAI